MLNKVLVFKNSGWCEKLSQSYEKGRYQPKDEKELEALKGFASEVITLDEEVKENSESTSEGEKSAQTSQTSEDKKNEVNPSKTSSDDSQKGDSEKEYSDEEVAELREKAKEAKIHNWHSKKPQTLVEELKTVG